MFRHMHRFCIRLKQSSLYFSLLLKTIKIVILFLSQSCDFNGYLIQLIFFTSTQYSCQATDVNSESQARTRNSLRGAFSATNTLAVCAPRTVHFSVDRGILLLITDFAWSFQYEECTLRYFQNDEYTCCLCTSHGKFQSNEENTCCLCTSCVIHSDRTSPRTKSWLERLLLKFTYSLRLYVSRLENFMTREFIRRSARVVWIVKPSKLK